MVVHGEESIVRYLVRGKSTVKIGLVSVAGHAAAAILHRVGAAHTDFQDQTFSEGPVMTKARKSAGGQNTLRAARAAPQG